MKNQKGITLISLIIYVLAMIIVIGAVANITKYFYHNVSFLTGGVTEYYVCTTFNSYFSEDINIYGNYVESCDGNSIQFGHNGNKYSFENNSIYYNSVKICSDVDECKFEYNSETEIIRVYIKSDDKEYDNYYTITKVNNKM